MTEKAPQFREILPDGTLRLNFHAGQAKAWDSTARFVFIIGGTQLGKTCFAPHWLLREIEARGEGDYIAATATFPLLDKKMLPEFLYVFEELHGLGTFNYASKVFKFKNDKTRIIFASAANPESIESATAKAAWLDECGQMQFRRETWEAVLRRLSLAAGRILGTTTLYGQGWLKNCIYDPWLAGDESIQVIQVDSIVNPAFPKEEYYRAMKTMPPWKFDLFYRGQFAKPAGLIYDSFDEKTCLIPRFNVPLEWPRYVGMDFGQHNTGVMFYAMEPATGNIFAYREYLSGGKEVAGHVADLKGLTGPENIIKRVGGAKTEDGWREAFGAAGWHVTRPRIGDVEVGIDKVYAWHKTNKLFVFNDLTRYLEEKQTYSRELDESYLPIEKISDKEKFHLMDAERYILSEFNPSFETSGKVLVRSFYG